MAAFEHLNLVQQTIHNMEGLRKDMRANAESYKTQAVTDPAKTAEIMQQDAVQYLRRLQWQKRIFQDDPAAKSKILAGFAVYQIDLTEALNDYQELKSAAVALNSATLGTPAQIIAAADNILNTVAAHETVWS